MLRSMLTLMAVLTVLAPAWPGAAQQPKPLFADPAPIHVVIRGPILSVIHKAARSTDEVDATLTAGDEAQALPIKLSARGRTRRQGGICQFPPLRIAFPDKPGEGSLFQGQKKLKLVTHCQGNASFQQYLLLEHAVYRMYDLLTPVSFRARLAKVDYIETNGRLVTSQMGFFLEDASDVAKRNGLREAKLGDRVPNALLDPAAAGRNAVFQYMISNLDWSMTASPKGEACCHNVKLIGAEGAASGLIPTPYDYDQSGLVDAPYAAPPLGINVENVRTRRYRGYCRHNAQAAEAAAAILSRRSEIMGVFDGLPQLTDSSRRKATSFLDGFFQQVLTPEGVDRMLKTCIG